MSEILYWTLKEIEENRGLAPLGRFAEHIFDAKAYIHGWGEPGDPFSSSLHYDRLLREPDGNTLRIQIRCSGENQISLCKNRRNEQIPFDKRDFDYLFFVQRLYRCWMIPWHHLHDEAFGKRSISVNFFGKFEVKDDEKISLNELQALTLPTEELRGV